MIRFPNLLIAAMVLIAAPAQAQQDLAVAVPADGLVVFRPIRADLEVIGWDRDSVRIVARDQGEVRIELERSSTGLQIHERRGVGDVEAHPSYQLRVPREAAIRLSARAGRITLGGLDGDVRAGVVNGSVTGASLGGPAHLSTVTGAVRVRGSRGSLEARSVEGDLVLEGIQGELRARSTSGDVRIRRAAPGPVHAESYSGSIRLEGALGRGSSSFATHSGNMELYLGSGAHATFFITAVEGDARVTCDGRTRRPGPGEPVQLGDGGHPVEVLTFTGRVRVFCASAGG